MGRYGTYKKIQFVLPSLADSYDIDIEKGKKQRLRIYKNLARKNTTIAGAHISYPGIGKLNKSKNKYEWIPFE